MLDVSIILAVVGSTILGVICAFLREYFWKKERGDEE